jgi:tRNA A-37 threonylcarbamoyl transferase component Bud32
VVDPARALRGAAADDGDLRVVAEHLCRDNPEIARLGGGSASLDRAGGLVDVLVQGDGDLPEPDEVFARLRWGGLYVYASRDAAAVAALPDRFGQRGYVTAVPPAFVRKPVMGLRLPLLSPRLHYFVARKVFLVRPREITERFTYHVQLVPGGDGPDGHVVSKEVPTLERVIARLRAKFTDVPYAVIEKRARKFTEKIFPLFLTREAAMLKILERDLPREFRNRVPRVLDLEQDGRGYVHRLWMTWLRQGTDAPLSQMQFARQSAELLQVIHDTVGIIHLDLRLDNVVITRDGVCFVDFGSSVRVGENINGNPMLSTIFEELMRTSQIQRMLYRMKSSGHVTSQVIAEAYQRVDKAVDLFYLALQMNDPLSNPDFHGLVEFDPNSIEAYGIEQLTHDILKPADPTRPPYRTAKDMLIGLKDLERNLRGEPAPV